MRKLSSLALLLIGAGFFFSAQHISNSPDLEAAEATVTSVALVVGGSITVIMAILLYFVRTEEDQ